MGPLPTPVASANIDRWERVSDVNVKARKEEEDDARMREQEKRDREEQAKQRFDTVALSVHLPGNAGQLKIYRHLFSFLRDKINSMNTLDPRLESLLPRLRTHFEKFVEYDIIESISESGQFRETLLETSKIVGDERHTTALDEDEKEICAHLKEVLLDSKDKSTIRSLHGEQAKCFMQVLQDALKRGSPSLHDDRLQKTAERMLIHLSKTCCDVPNELYIKGTIKNVSLRPINMEGGFGHIYRGRWNERPVALKRLFRVEDTTLVQKFCKEAMIWKNLCDHPHILPFLGVDIESFPGEMCMVSEWMSKGTIIEFLKSEPHHAVEKYLLQIAEGIQHLHSQEKYHGDLKGENILVGSDRKAKIADFGFANFDNMSVSYSAPRMGSPRWMAPELLDNSQKFQRTTKSDIFAFACIAFEIYAGSLIFPGDNNPRACQRILAGERPEQPADGRPMPNRMWNLIEWCWSQDPSSRPKIEDVVKKMREIGGSAPVDPHPPQMPNPTDHSYQQYSSLQPSPTPEYDHASLSPHPPAPPPLSGSTPYDPSFPVPAAPIRRPFTDPGRSGLPPALSPILYRAAIMPMPNTAPSVPYDMQSPNTMDSPSQPGIPGGPQSAPGWSYLDMHERDDDSSDSSDEDLEQSREGTRHSGEYKLCGTGHHQTAIPLGDNRVGTEATTPDGLPQQPEIIRCTCCGMVTTRADAENRRWYCTGGHMGQWQRA